MNNGILKVSEESRKTIDAIGVKLHLTIQGENFVFGNAAIEKCLDVKSAVTKIVSVDQNSTITIDGVTIKSDTGWFMKGSKGDYRITVQLSEMSKVNDVLGAIMELKSVSMDSLEWEYDEYTAKVLLIEESVKRCKNKAEVIATTLGKTIVGIRTCSDSYNVPDVNIQAHESFIESVRVRRNVAVPGDFGTEVKGKKEISAVATIEFFLSNSGSV